MLDSQKLRRDLHKLNPIFHSNKITASIAQINNIKGCMAFANSIHKWNYLLFKLKQIQTYVLRMFPNKTLGQPSHFCLTLV